MRRAQLWMLVFTGVWFATIILGVWWCIAGLRSPDISSDQRDWSTYPPFDPNWLYQVGIQLALLGLAAAALDGVTRMTLLIIWLRRRATSTAAPTVLSR